ncbi:MULTISPECIES: glutathione S-transferase family protein [unclassified Caulobacter]|uniref:glutathione S-transferase family protein n=1 Tax=unclassified Caulobacter TaxID=2648921 RepID=UPI0006F6F53A|nr:MULTISPECIES: glutathione S-transferase family protein [unclassified Caulobacter]KQV62471.1 glutathione S-transferase [Caulobacter sp. Root342]KQV65519.1 glutathione S-transferase [Caulobacter sp. Root343]
MSSYRIFSALGSGGVPVEAAMSLIGLPYEVVEAPTWEGEAEQAKVAVVNPLKQIPALVTPAGETITESAAILIWLADKFPEARLGPAVDAPERAQFLRWMTFIPASIYSLFWVRDQPSRLGGDDPEVQARIKAATAERILDCWAMMESQVSPGLYLLGDQLTVLDLYVTVVSRWGPRRVRFYEVAPRMAEVVRRVDADPRLAGFWAQRFPFFDGWERLGQQG